MSFLIILLFRAITLMSDQANIESIHKSWMLTQVKPVTNVNDELKGYWNFYGMDILTISDDTICTYSFLESDPIDCLPYAYSESDKTLNIFIGPESWQKETNTFSVTLKVVNLNKNELILLYTISNLKNQVYGQLMELHYSAIDSFPIKSSLQSLYEILSSKRWDSKEHMLFLSNDEKLNKTYRYKTKDSISSGIWHLYEIGKNKLLVLTDSSDKNHLYQIKEVEAKQIILIHLVSNEEIVLSPLD